MIIHVANLLCGCHPDWEGCVDFEEGLHTSNYFVLLDARKFCVYIESILCFDHDTFSVRSRQKLLKLSVAINAQIDTKSVPRGFGVLGFWGFGES